MAKIRSISFLLALTAAHACSKSQPATPVSPSCSFAVTSQTTGFGASGGSGTANVTTTAGCAWSASSQVDWIHVGGDRRSGSGSVSFSVAASEQTTARSGVLTIASQPVSISQEGAAGPAPQPCDVALSAEPDDFERDGGNGIVRISTRAGCAWAIKQDATWLRVEGPTDGSGPAALTVFAQPNEDVAARRVRVSIGDQAVVISQPGQGDCTFQVSPVNTAIPRTPFTADVTVTTSPGCRWTSSSDASWLHLDPRTASGAGKLTYNAEFNPDTAYSARRTGQIAIRWAAPTAGQNVFVTQWGDCGTAFGPGLEALPRHSSYSAGTLTVGPDGGTFHFFVLTEPFMGCAWTVESNDSWFHLDSPRFHQVMGGDGDVHFTVPANSSAQGRRGVLVIGERPLTIVQQGRQ